MGGCEHTTSQLITHLTGTPSEGEGEGGGEFCTVGRFCCFCMFNIEVPVDPWEIMAFRYAHDL